MIVLDLETYYDSKSKYDLKHMSTSEYCYNEQAKCHCMAWLDTNTGEEGCEWDEAHIMYKLASWYQDEEVLVAFNGFFDFQFILATDLGELRPKKLFCAQLMALHLLGVNYSKGHKISLKEVGSTLKTTVTKHEGAGDTSSFDGIKEIDEDHREHVTKYALDDVRTTALIIKQIEEENKLGNQHMWTINWALRQYLFPKIKLDHVELEHVILQEHMDRQKALNVTGVKDPSVFRSVGKWKDLVEEAGFTVPMKKNPKGVDIPQAAKSDPFIKENMNRKDQLGKLIRARLLFSSNQVATRAESYLKIARLDIGDDSLWPMHVWPSGAHTHRITGQNGGGGNPLNLDKNLAKKKFGIRNALVAPDGFKFIVFDYSGIELRVCRWLCNDEVSKEAILGGQDLYKVFASMAFNTPYENVTDEQRFIGKQGELSLQYGLGHVKFKSRLAQEGVEYSEEEAKTVVDQFRKQVHAPVRQTWGNLDALLESFTQQQGDWYLKKLNMPDHEWNPQQGIWWPSGRLLSYYGRTSKAGEYGRENVYYPRAPWGDKNNEVVIWGGTMLENICQSITNEIIDERKRMIEQELGVETVLEVYDEMVLLVEGDKAKELVPKVEEIAKRPINWWTDGPPLDIESVIVKRYGNAK